MGEPTLEDRQVGKLARMKRLVERRLAIKEEKRDAVKGFNEDLQEIDEELEALAVRDDAQFVGTAP